MAHETVALPRMNHSLTLGATALLAALVGCSSAMPRMMKSVPGSSLERQATASGASTDGEVKPVDDHQPVIIETPRFAAVIDDPPADTGEPGKPEQLPLPDKDDQQIPADASASAATAENADSEEQSSQTQAPPEQSDSGTDQPVDYFVELGLRGSPQLRAARQRVAAEINRLPQARALPDPKFQNTFWPINDHSIQTAAGRVGNQMTVSQDVPWPEKLSTQASIVNREVQIARVDVQRIEREITESVRLAYYEIWYATRAIQIVQELRDLVLDLTEVAEARYRIGGSQQDVLRAELEIDRLDDRLVTLTEQKETSQADLAALVQRPVSLMPEATEELAISEVPRQLQQATMFAEECSPELRRLQWEVARDRQKQRLADLQQYPDLKFGAHWGLVSDEDALSRNANGHDNFSFTVGISLPIWRGKINAGIREAGNRTASSLERLEAERDTLYGRLRRFLAQADALVRQREIFTDRLIPRTEDTLELAVADYRGKRTDFFTLIETYRELLTFQIQLARLHASLAGKLANIERAIGCARQQRGDSDSDAESESNEAP